MVVVASDRVPRYTYNLPTLLANDVTARASPSVFADFTHVPMESQEQCDQMASLFYNVWPFTSMKNCPMAYKICQRQSKYFPNSK